MLKDVYEGEFTARVVMKRLATKPIAEALSDPGLADELINTASERCRRFVELLRRHGTRGVGLGTCRD